MRRKSLEDKLYPNLKKVGNCLEWQLATNNKGYGRLSHLGKGYLAHRLVYILEKGKIPDNIVIRHTCDNRICCNVNHMVLGTNKDNSGDMVSRGRSLKGEKQHNAKLTEATVKLIKQRYETEKISQVKLAKEYGISRAQVGRIVRGERWNHLEKGN